MKRIRNYILVGIGSLVLGFSGGNYYNKLQNEATNLENETKYQIQSANRIISIYKRIENFSQGLLLQGLDPSFIGYAEDSFDGHLTEIKLSLNRNKETIIKLKAIPKTRKVRLEQLIDEKIRNIDQYLNQVR